METRGIQYLKEQGVQFEVRLYEYAKSSDKSVAEIASEQTGIEPERMIKSLVVKLKNGEFVFALMPADKKISMKKLAKAAGAKSASMSKPDEAERITGYKVGGVSPFGSKQALRVFMDSSLEDFDFVGINGGGRGVILKVSMDDLKRLLNPVIEDLAG